MRKKELLARGLSPLMQGTMLRWLCRRNGGTRVLALVYHRVYDDPDRKAWSDPELRSADVDGFRMQMELLARHFFPLTLDQLPHVLDGTLECPRPPVLVTFDDGYRDNHEIVLPVLSETGVPANFFVSTGYIGTERMFWFDYLYMICRFLPAGTHELPGMEGAHALNSLDTRHRVAIDWIEHCFMLAADEVDAIVDAAESLHDAVVPDEARAFNLAMDWDQVRALAEAGMGIGSHTVTHPLLRNCDARRKRQELLESRNQLEQRLGRRIDCFAYPVGKDFAMPDDGLSLRSETGYRYFFSYEPGVIRSDSDASSLPRMPVEQGQSLAWTKAMLALPEVFHD